MKKCKILASILVVGFVLGFVGCKMNVEPKKTGDTNQESSSSNGSASGTNSGSGSGGSIGGGSGGGSGTGSCLEEPTVRDLATLLVNLSERTLQIGDLIMSDDKVLPYSADYTTEEWTNFDKSKVVAVIIREKASLKSALGVGVKQPGGLAWAKNNTPGYDTNFTEIQCTPMKDVSKSWGVWDDAKTWDGDTDGSDNWEQIKAFFENEAQSDNKAKGIKLSNYPAFEYAQIYASHSAGDAKLQGTTYATGWFLPSIAELVEIYQSKTIVNKVLNALGSENAQHMKNGWYWSSSQDCYDSGLAECLDFRDGYVGNGYKPDDDLYVCVVRAF